MTCVACGGQRFLRLTDPNAAQCTLSDFSIIPRSLAKIGCESCGLVFGQAIPEHEASFGPDYSLYAHEPGDPHEAQRQSQYARWLGDTLTAPGSAYEAGAGNGSLLLALRDVWRLTLATGIEAARGAVRCAVAAGLSIEHGFLGPANGAEQADLAFAINVIEHTRDPVSFTRDLATHGSTVAIVCPDGDVVSSELLFADHLFSFGRSQMRAIVAAAGLRVENQHSAPDSLGAFFMTIATQGAPDSLERPSAKRTLGDVDRYLSAWRALDDTLAERLPANARIACFGAGEAAALLCVYAPRTWGRIEYCTMDSPTVQTFAGKQVVPYRAGSEVDAFVLATRPQSQAAIARRLENDGKRSVRYDDVIPA